MNVVTEPCQLIRLMQILCLVAIAYTNGCASSETRPVTPAQREAEIRELLHDNLSWGYGTHALVTPYRWPHEDDVIEVFEQLTDADIPILIGIIRADVAQGKALTDAETNSAHWVLSFFIDKAKPQILQIYNDPSLSQVEKKYGKTS